jgi:UDP-2-acetamido-3-amino-2,3-dideoxy-glucuronate N-acetyltransferase
MSMIHPLSDVGECQIGAGTRIWQFAIILNGARIGRDCNINAHTFIEGDVVLGDRVTVKSGVYLWNGTRIGDDVFIGPSATFTNDRSPRSKQYPDRFYGPTIERNVSVGANATILPGLTLGEYAMVGAGTVLTRDVPPHALVYGSPGTVKGYVCQCGQKLDNLCCATCGAEYGWNDGRVRRLAEK